MKYSLISVMDYRFGIFSERTPEYAKLGELDCEPVILFPSLKGDFEIVLPNNENDGVIYLSLVLAALHFYFFKIRGIPLHEIGMTHSVSNFSLETADKSDLKLEKCKYNFSKETYETKGVLLERFSFEKFLIFPCENIGFFDGTALPAALLKSGRDFDTAVAFSRSGCEISVKKCGAASQLETIVVILKFLISSCELNEIKELVFAFENGQKVGLKFNRTGRFEFYPECEFLGFFEY